MSMISSFFGVGVESWGEEFLSIEIPGCILAISTGIGGAIY